MKRIVLILGFAALAMAAPGGSVADLPDPLVGSDSRFELSRGNTYPAAFVPFGMINWTARTGEGGWPYQFTKDRIQDFLATHRPSAWMADYGAFSLMPVTGSLKVLPAERGSRFRHENEEARAYRYSVMLEDYKVRAELAPSRRGGIFRFTFPKTGQAYVVFDAGYGPNTTIELHPENNTITGKNTSISGGYPWNFAQYFVAEFDRPFTAYGTWDDTATYADVKYHAGKSAGGYVQFAAVDGAVVTVRIATSLISVEEAKRNLAAELPDTGFDQVVSRARQEWERELGKIEIQGGTAAQRSVFYTSLYRAFQLPRGLHETDANGRTVHYSPYDGKIHDGPMYADNGFWDTFRAQFPLLTLVQPKRDGEIIRGLLNAYDEGGWIPKWPNPGYTNIMIGTHGDSVVADAFMKGIRDYDVEKAYAALRKDATQPGTGRYKARIGIEDYLKLGYVAADTVEESAASTLEYAYDDFCVAQMARALGKDDDYRTFTAHSKNYRNIFDPKTGFMRGRKSDGSWVEPFDPLAWGDVFTEGNAWQWLWSVQHDVAGLMDLLGGKDAFTRKLDTLFSMTPDFHVGGYGDVIHEMTEAKMANTGQYAHINEPVHHVIYLYDYAGQPWKAQKWIRTIMDKFYQPGPAGLLGDEDTGQMSSWYVFSALGFYPVNPGQPIYALGTPLFDSATLHLENGKQFTVKAVRQNPADIYVQSATLNGAPLDRVWIRHSEITDGGVLEFRLGPQPNQGWATSGIPAAN